MKFGERLRATREALRMSQAAAAHAAHVSPVFFSQIETGQRLPSFKVTKSIAIALGLHWPSMCRAVLIEREADLAAVFDAPTACLDCEALRQRLREIKTIARSGLGVSPEAVSAEAIQSDERTDDDAPGVSRGGR